MAQEGSANRIVFFVRAERSSEVISNQYSGVVSGKVAATGAAVALVSGNDFIKFREFGCGLPNAHATDIPCAPVRGVDKLLRLGSLLSCSNPSQGL